MMLMFGVQASACLLDFEIPKLKLELQTSLIFTLTNY